MKTCLYLLTSITLAAACGPGPRGGDDTGDDTGPPDARTCTPTAASEGPGTCNDGFDNDCDLIMDCGEIECSEIDGCPVIGENCEVSTPSAELSLPDGQCTGVPPPPGSPPAQFEAFLMTCSSYEATLNLSGFPSGARLTDTAGLLGVCVKMEHSWLRDLQMEAYCPDGNRVLLSRFQGQTGGEVYLGEANDFDDAQNPVPGVGWDYCWTEGATNPPMIDHANATGTGQLPAGDYRPSESFTGFMGCNLNGGWRIRVVDGWGIDNGFIFESKFVFAASLSDECPIIE